MQTKNEQKLIKIKETNMYIDCKEQRLKIRESNVWNEGKMVS